MQFTRFNDVYDTPVVARLGEIKIKKNKMTIRICCPADGRQWESLMLGYAYKIESDKENYIFTPDSVEDRGRTIDITNVIDLEEFPFRSTHWQIRAVYREGQKLYGARVVMEPVKQDPWDFLFHPRHYFTKDNYIVFPYTSREGYAGLRYREATKGDSFGTRFREWRALNRYTKHKEEYDAENILLVYEKKCEKAQDNGYYFFKYCMDNDMESYLGRKIYYVITEDSVDRDKLKPYQDHVIDFLSMKHMTSLLACRALVSPDARAHSYIWQYDKSLIAGKANKKPHVFLGHGVLALKKLNSSFLAKNMNSVMTTVTSQAEADIVVNDLGFRRHAAAITGYSRFDALEDAKDKYNEILIMPTHRSWLFGVERDVFTASDYYRRYMDLINSPEFIGMLKERGMKARFYLHPSIREHADAFTSSDDCVEIVPYGKYSLDELMMRCKLLVTDYSSICWDVYYMGKPVIFYQYDLPEYLQTWGSYIDLEKDSPGKRAESHEQLIEAIRQSMDQDFALDEVWAARQSDYFQYVDRDNSRRICEALKERGL